MKKSDLRSATNEALIRRFEELAVIHGELRAAKEANQAYVQGVAIWNELRRRGSVAVEMFLQLLQSSNPVIRLAVAANVLFVAPARAEAVLEQLTKESDGRFTAFTAAMTLKEWRSGRLKPTK